MRWVAIALAAVLVMAAGMGSAQTPSSTPPVKLALVIGNADYDGDGRIDVSAAGVASSESRGFVPDLRNPLNDAGDIRDALQRIGFRVDYVVNADGARMGAVLAEFGTKVAAAPDTAQIVVYYAGHAIQVDGANFLIPVKAQLPATDFSTMPTSQVQTVLRRVAVSTTEITEQLKQLRAPGVNLLMFDACRNNPWETRVRGLGRSVSATRGLAEIAAPPRTVIAFSTAPGRTADDGAGRNSPFAGVLKNWIARPGTVLQMLDGVGGEVQTATGGRQTPWFQSASVGQVCLASCNVDADRAAMEAELRRAQTEVESLRRGGASSDANRIAQARPMCLMLREAADVLDQGRRPGFQMRSDANIWSGPVTGFQVSLAGVTARAEYLYHKGQDSYELQFFFDGMAQAQLRDYVGHCSQLKDNMTAAAEGPPFFRGRRGSDRVYVSVSRVDRSYNRLRNVYESGARIKLEQVKE